MSNCLNKLRSYLDCSTLKATTDDLRKRYNLYRLILDFSFVPQIVAATVIYMFVKGESAVLLDNYVAAAYLTVFSEIFILAVVNISKRFYFTRYLLALSYVQLMITGVLSGYTRAYFRFFSFAVLGIALCFINICALYGWKKLSQSIHLNNKDD